MSHLRFALLGLALAAAACSAPTGDSSVGADTAAYSSSHSSHTIHTCMTTAAADDGAALVTWASFNVFSDNRGRHLSASMKLALTADEIDTLRNAHPYEFSDGVGTRADILESATVEGSHYESQDGAIALDLDLSHPHTLAHGELSHGNGSATFTFDFGSTTQIIPDRIRALGERTFSFDLADCD